MRALCALAASVAAFFAAPALGAGMADDERSVSSKVLSSIAMVAVPGDTGYAIGTAWCFWSTASESYFLTNEHVVASASGLPMLKLAVNRNDAAYAALVPGRLYRKPGPDYNDIDLAVIVVDVGHVPLLAVQAYVDPEAGTSVGIAGYPSFELEKADAEGTEIFPSVHFGHVNSTPYSSRYIEYDATADHGNSGGPLFDATNAVVVGVVRLGIASQTSRAVQNNLAIRGSDVDSYLDALWLPHFRHTNDADRRVVPCRDFAAVGLEAQKAFWCGLPDAIR